MKSRSKLITMALALIAGIATLMATISANACFPWTFYQPKCPKSLIKED